VLAQIFYCFFFAFISLFSRYLYINKFFCVCFDLSVFCKIDFTKYPFSVWLLLLSQMVGALLVALLSGGRGAAWVLSIVSRGRGACWGAAVAFPPSTPFSYNQPFPSACCRGDPDGVSGGSPLRWSGRLWGWGALGGMPEPRAHISAHAPMRPRGQAHSSVAAALLFAISNDKNG